MNHLHCEPETVLRIIEYFLGFIFLYSSIMKVKSFNRFSSSIIAFPLNRFVASSVIVFELLLVILFFSNRAALPAVLSALFLLIATAYIIFTLATKKKVSCYCFGDDTDIVSTSTLIRNLVLLSLSLVGIVLSYVYNANSIFKLQHEMLSVVFGLIFFLMFVITIKIADFNRSLQS